jgi:hypothetical protein
VIQSKVFKSGMLECAAYDDIIRALPDYG